MRSKFRLNVVAFLGGGLGEGFSGKRFFGKKNFKGNFKKKNNNLSSWKNQCQHN